jgi:hypothetical protein
MANEWNVIDLATELGMSTNTLFISIRRGRVQVLRRVPGYRGRIICCADTGAERAERQHRNSRKCPAAGIDRSLDTGSGPWFVVLFNSRVLGLRCMPFDP